MKLDTAFNSEIASKLLNIRPTLLVLKRRRSKVEPFWQSVEASHYRYSTTRICYLAPDWTLCHCYCGLWFVVLMEVPCILDWKGCQQEKYIKYCERCHYNLQPTAVVLIGCMEPRLKMAYYCGGTPILGSRFQFNLGELLAPAAQ